MPSTSETTSQTLAALEARLQRIDYVLNGRNTDTSEAAQDEDATATARLRILERQLHALTAHSQPAADVVQLQSQHPTLFHPATSASPSTTLPSSSLAQLILAQKSLYTRLSSQLNTLQNNSNNSLPDSDAFAKLVALGPRIEAASRKQAQQATEFAELRARSADLVQWWYERGVLGMGERWAEWEESMREVEITVRRMEGAKKREEGLV